MNCKNCGSSKITRHKKRISNGTYQVIDQCDWCNQNARGNGINVPHREVNNLEALPLLADYSAHAPKCEVCGSGDGTELHHYAPRHIFGDQAERYPQGYLCRDCHRDWHIGIASHNQADCRYCKGLAVKGVKV